ncbi:Serine-protein kinase RsbW [Crateriforma conspicua]|uniref:Serine-protein kinase RsbW n=2 Tax=Crateriforma conspicua TaxID=2527996 RepID=A0A5C5Y0T8_9PLAN|nr:Serine-protein kinase RsbW [Crateriforma conspicua]
MISLPMHDHDSHPDRLSGADDASDSGRAPDAHPDPDARLDACPQRGAAPQPDAESETSSDVERWQFRQHLPSDLSVGSQLGLQLADAMRQYGWPDEEVFRVHLAYEEAIANAIRHGNRHDTEKRIEVHLHCDGHEVQIRITDEGDGFDPDAVPDPTSEHLLEAPGGRGVLLIREIMSDVRFNDDGNQIWMAKRRA